jgi:signal-transduction protein with cAMP-binding, CBS, and nucleotidyltransferase domain
MPESMTRVTELMTRDVIDTIGEDGSVADAARRMRERKRGCLIVTARGKPVGILTERDLVQRVIAEGRSPEKTKVSEVMSSPAITVGPEALVSDAATIMLQNRIRRLPVVEGTDVLGMLTVTDFAKFLQRRSGQDPMLAAMARAAVVLAQT